VCHVDRRRPIRVVITLFRALVPAASSSRVLARVLLRLAVGQVLRADEQTLVALGEAARLVRFEALVAAESQIGIAVTVDTQERGRALKME
jgi:hypothetical protein